MGFVASLPAGARRRTIRRETRYRSNLASAYAPATANKPPSTVSFLGMPAPA
jgi:hypothetical protein